jgi:hypothetical protein
MAHFAQINDGFVEQVIVVANEVLLDEDGVEQESIGKDFCSNTFGGKWVQTSYNANIRGKYAAIGDFYDEVLDEFVTNSQS